MTLKPFACPECGKAFKKEVAVGDHRRDAHKIATSAADPADRNAAPSCIECGEIASLVGGVSIYPHRPDLYPKRFWLCACGAYCGCHGATANPLGNPAGPATRRARSAAHAAFDPIWRGKTMSRGRAYGWLADAMGLAVPDCHIGMMTAAQAWQVVRLCETRIAA